MNKLGGTIRSSALLILFKKLTRAKALAEIEPYELRVLKASLSNDAEQKLKTVLSKAAGRSDLRKSEGHRRRE